MEGCFPFCEYAVFTADLPSTFSAVQFKALAESVCRSVVVTSGAVGDLGVSSVVSFFAVLFDRTQTTLTRELGNGDCE